MCNICSLLSRALLGSTPAFALWVSFGRSHLPRQIVLRRCLRLVRVQKLKKRNTHFIRQCQVEMEEHCCLLRVYSTNWKIHPHHCSFSLSGWKWNKALERNFTTNCLVFSQSFPSKRFSTWVEYLLIWAQPSGLNSQKSTGGKRLIDT